MKRLAVFSLLFAGIVTAVSAAVPQQRRGQATTQSAPAAGATAARSAVSARSATARSAAPAPTATTAARSATAGRTTVARGGTTAAAPTTVSARAGVTQKVIGTGTKVAAATKNTVVSEACQQKYDGCMDSFCMLDNDTGGRCICSNRNAELDDILAEIEKLDQQSYQMATAGVERIEMGADADAAIASANAAAQSVMKAEQASGSKRRTLDLSMWDTFTFDDDEDIFGEGNTLQSVIDGKQGDALHRAAAELCVAQMPECANEISMLQMMYAQKIKNDCSAYENSLKQQKNSSAQKLAAAEKALREAALDQLRTANKYDLGQCTVEFKKCMASTGGCGDDFKGCVGIAASEQIKGQTPKQVSITGSKTKITIAASTYDTLEAKKPMCMSVTNSCVAVADQVWDTFMREVAPQLKTAELLAESDLRTSCISNISDCFQKACKDTIDPNDPDGSYDMCLSRPETVKSLCKVQIDPCVAAEPLILDFVYARLAAMRVDACTNDDLKAMMCAALATDSAPVCQQYRTDENGDPVCTQYGPNTLDDVFSETGAEAGVTGDDTYSTKYVISGVKFADLAAAQQRGHSTYTQTDSKGNMIGKISTSAAFEPSTDTCVLTTTTTMCSKMKEIITTDTYKSCSKGGISLFAGSCGGGLLQIGGNKKFSGTTQTYQGVACQEFLEPVTTTVNIQM